MEDTQRAIFERILDAEIPCQGVSPSLHINVFTIQEVL